MPATVGIGPQKRKSGILDAISTVGGVLQGVGDVVNLGTGLVDQFDGTATARNFAKQAESVAPTALPAVQSPGLGGSIGDAMLRRAKKLGGSYA